MRILALICLASISSCTASNRYALTPAGEGASPGSCCDADCDVSAECLPDGTCRITCTNAAGEVREFDVECSASGAACNEACKTSSCDVDVECLPDGGCRVTCTGPDGKNCSVDIDCDSAKCSTSAKDRADRS